MKFEDLSFVIILSDTVTVFGSYSTPYIMTFSFPASLSWSPPPPNTPSANNKPIIRAAKAKSPNKIQRGGPQHFYLQDFLFLFFFIDLPSTYYQLSSVSE